MRHLDSLLIDRVAQPLVLWADHRLCLAQRLVGRILAAIVGAAIAVDCCNAVLYPWLIGQSRHSTTLNVITTAAAAWAVISMTFVALQRGSAEPVGQLRRDPLRSVRYIFWGIVVIASAPPTASLCMTASVYCYLAREYVLAAEPPPPPRRRAVAAPSRTRTPYGRLASGGLLPSPAS